MILKFENEMTKLEKELCNLIGKTHSELTKKWKELKKDFEIKNVVARQTPEGKRIDLYINEQHGYIVVFSPKGYQQCEEIEEF